MDCLQGTRSCRQLEETSPKHKRRGTGKFTLLWLQQSLQRVNQTIKNPMGTHHCSRINPFVPALRQQPCSQPKVLAVREQGQVWTTNLLLCPPLPQSSGRSQQSNETPSVVSLTSPAPRFCRTATKKLQQHNCCSSQLKRVQETLFYGGRLVTPGLTQWRQVLICTEQK